MVLSQGDGGQEGNTEMFKGSVTWVLSSGRLMDTFEYLQYTLSGQKRKGAFSVTFLALINLPEWQEPPAFTQPACTPRKAEDGLGLAAWGALPRLFPGGYLLG